MTYAIEIKDLVKTYKTGTKALKGVNLTIEDGDFFALLGANGAGKTTIIGIATGLVNKSEGSIKIYGHDTDTDSINAKMQIGVVPQEFNFSIFEKVEDIIMCQAGYYGIPRKIAQARCHELLHALELFDKRQSPARTLSGGMKRRLMIARALIHNPKLLILDEPTAGVDVELRRSMWEYLKKINQQGTTILLTTHYLEEAEQLCRNIAIIKQGEIVMSDSTKNILSSLDQESYIINVDSVPANFKLENCQVLDENRLQIELKKGESLNVIIEQLSQQNIQIMGISPKENRLEQLFINIINK